MEADFKYIAFGAGVQSTALLIMSNLGLHGVPRADMAIFADTGDEPAYVYDTLERMAEWSDIPVRVVSTGRTISDAAFDPDTSGRTSVPTWFMGLDGKPKPMSRTCTAEFKIAPIEQAIKIHLGYEKLQRMRHHVEAWLGISVDEWQREKPSKTAWVTKKYPLLDARLTREMCYDVIQDAGLEVPMRSSCVFCPFSSNAYWLWLKNEHPEDFERACAFDDQLRQRQPGNLDVKRFVHKSCTPLRSVDLEDLAFKDGFGNECEGYCGI